MGHQNVTLAHTYWPHLPDRVFRVLVVMCIRAMDDDDPPLYYGGRDYIADRIGRPGNMQVIKECLLQLRKAGVVRIKERCGPGKGTVYSLHLTRHGGGSDTTVKRWPVDGAAATVVDDSTQRGRDTQPTVVDQSTNGGGSDTTQGDRGGTRRKGGDNSAQVTTSPAPVENQPAPRPIPAIPGPCINGHRQIGRRLVECEDCHGQGCDRKETRP
jgi:hypothetical protein